MPTPSLNITHFSFHAQRATDMYQSFLGAPTLRLEHLIKVMFEAFGYVRCPILRSKFDTYTLRKGPFEARIAAGAAPADIDAVVLYADATREYYPLVVIRAYAEDKKISFRVIEHTILANEHMELACGFDLLNLLVDKAKAYTAQVVPGFRWDI